LSTRPRWSSVVTRASPNTRFRADARRGKTTPGNVDDRRPVPCLVRHFVGKRFGDKGYLSQALAAELLAQHGLQLVTKARSNMRGRLLRMVEKLLLRKWAIIESANDQLKNVFQNVCQIEHTRQRSPYNFLAHLIASLVAYYQ